MSRRFLALSLLLLAAPSAFAGPGDVRPLGFDEAVSLARQHNRDLRAARERLNQAESDIERARVPLLPQVVAQGKYTLNHPEAVLSFASELQAKSAKLQQDLFADLYRQTGKIPSPEILKLTEEISSYCKNNPKSRDCDSSPIVIQQRHQVDAYINAQIPIVVPAAYPGLKAAREAYAAQAAGNDAAVGQLLAGVAAAFYAAAGAEEVAQAVRHGIEVAQQTLTNAKARFAAGVSTRVDVTRAEIAVVRAEQALRGAEDGAAAAYRGLATLIQLREPFKVQVGEEPAVPAEDVEAMLRKSLTLRPEYRSYDHQLAATDASLLATKLRWAPSLSAFALLRVSNIKSFTGENWGFAAGVQLDWHLFDGGLRLADQHRSESMLAEAQLRLDQLRDQIGDEIVNQRRTLDTKRKAVESARREVALADETLKLARVQREAGTVTELEVLAAQDALLQAEVGVARARFDLALADVQLRRAVGTFPSP